MSVFLFGSGGSSDMKLIFSTKLTSSANTISTGTLATGYRGLVIDVVARCDSASSVSAYSLKVAFNGDNNVSNYRSSRALWRNNVAGSAFDNPIIGCVTDSSNSNQYATNRIVILNHEETNNYKGLQTIAQCIGTQGTLSQYTGAANVAIWENTDAITSIEFRVEENNFNFVAGSSVAVYGLK